MTYAALIVEDNQNAAALHAEMFDELDVHAVLALSPEDAVKKLLNMPSFDLIVSDLDFDDGAGAPNTRGSEVGKWLQDRHYPAISALCSAQHEEGSKAYRDSLQYFDAPLTNKAELSEYQELLEKAKDNKKSRLDRSMLRIDPSLASKRKKALIKVHSLIDAAAEQDNDVYFRDGFSILCAQPEVESFPVASPFFVWKKDIDEGCYLEVYGQPLLMAFGESLEDALSVLNDVLVSTHKDLSTGLNSDRLSCVKVFLETLYDDGFLDLD